MVFTISTGSPLNRRSRTISVSHSLVQSVSLIVLFNQCLSQSRTISVSHSLVQSVSLIVSYNQCLSQSRTISVYHSLVQSVSLIVLFNQCLSQSRSNSVFHSLVQTVSLIVSKIVLAQRKSRRKNNFCMNETMAIAIKVPQVFRCCILIFPHTQFPPGKMSIYSARLIFPPYSFSPRKNEYILNFPPGKSSIFPPYQFFPLSYFNRAFLVYTSMHAYGGRHTS